MFEFEQTLYGGSRLRSVISDRSAVVRTWSEEASEMYSIRNVGFILEVVKQRRNWKELLWLVKF